MKTYLLHHTPKSASQDTWAVSFSLPYIATEYVRAGDGVWYVRTWLTADQISKRLAILFDTADELRVVELGRKEAALNNRMQWLQGRLEDEEPVEMLNAPRLMWEALANAAQSYAFSRSAPLMAASAGNSRAA
jgi:DNA-binding transcriptional LysR family regulator